MNGRLSDAELARINNELRALLETEMFYIKYRERDGKLVLFKKQNKEYYIESVSTEILDALDQDELITFLYQAAINQRMREKGIRGFTLIVLCSIALTAMVSILFGMSAPEPFQEIVASVVSMIVGGIGLFSIMFIFLSKDQYRADEFVLSSRPHLIEVYQKLEELTKSKGLVVSYRRRIDHLCKYRDVQEEKREIS